MITANGPVDLVYGRDKGLNGVDGIVWFRKKITVKRTYPEGRCRQRAAVIDLAMIDDNIIYINVRR